VLVPAEVMAAAPADSAGGKGAGVCEGLKVLTAAADAQMSREVVPAAEKKTLKRKDGDTHTRKCLSCGTSETPKWRCGMTLCNACGLRTAKRCYNGRSGTTEQPSLSPMAVSQLLRDVAPPTEWPQVPAAWAFPGHPQAAFFAAQPFLLPGGAGVGGLPGANGAGAQPGQPPVFFFNANPFSGTPGAIPTANPFRYEAHPPGA